MSDGFLILDKRVGLTSFEALGLVKKTFGTRRVGHAGTLDRFASGVLVALVGSYTRLSDYFMASEKEYRATARFGIETDTLDPEGRIVAEAQRPSVEALRAALSSFKGTIMQRPPRYSAVHMNGVRAYERALRGETVEPAARPVTITSITLESYDGCDAVLSIVCSKGTYIRSLARDIADACGSVAHLIALRRLRSGPFRVEDADALGDGKRAPRALDMESACSLGLVPAAIPDALRTKFLNGTMLSVDSLLPQCGAIAEGDTVAVFSDNRLLGLAQSTENRLRYLAVLGRQESSGNNSSTAPLETL